METELFMNTPLFDKDKGYTECERCNGDGWVYSNELDDNGDFWQVQCSSCNGSGQIEIED